MRAARTATIGADCCPALIDTPAPMTMSDAPHPVAIHVAA
jgi:hypothetical protein